LLSRICAGLGRRGFPHRRRDPRPPEQRARLVHRVIASDARTRGLDPAARLATGLPCAFLEDGACAIYAERPLT
jgi:hypothetical protein